MCKLLIDNHEKVYVHVKRRWTGTFQTDIWWTIYTQYTSVVQMVNVRCFRRLGRFDTLSCFLICIEKLWDDGDLRDLLVDFGGVYWFYYWSNVFRKTVHPGNSRLDSSVWNIIFFIFRKWCDTILNYAWFTLSNCHYNYNVTEESKANKAELTKLILLPRSSSV
jgi:hypothetical protein